MKVSKLNVTRPKLHHRQQNITKKNLDGSYQ